MVLLNNKYFAPWLALLFISIYTCVAGVHVLQGEMELGIFITNIAVFKNMGGAFGDIYAIWLRLESVFPALIEVVVLLNRPTDLRERMKVDRSQREKTTDLRHELRKQGNNQCLDLLPIILRDIAWEVENDVGGMKLGMKICLAGTMKINQGKMACLVGHPGAGKSTVLRILGGAFLPKNGFVQGEYFVPSHLRVLHVPCHVIFMSGTLFDNLVYGAISEIEKEPKRVRDILARLNLQAVGERLGCADY